MIFDGVKYHLPSTLLHDRQLQLNRRLTRHNAVRADSVFDATHIITNSEVFESWRDVGAEVIIVTDLWVEGSIAAGKMQQALFYSTSPSRTFSGVVACSADLRATDEDVMSVGITSLGGQWRMDLTKDVTHLFAQSATSERYFTGMQHRDRHHKVLLPDWFDDTILLGTPDLSTETYEWPDPEVLKRRTDSRMHLQHAEKPGVWGGWRILLSTNLELAGSRRRIVEDDIRKSQGMPVEFILKAGEDIGEEELRLVDDCDVFVTRHRTGPAFFKAWREGKTIGTLSWLLDVQVTGVRSSPLDRILHFPTPPGAVEGFDKVEISITNYTRESREYLKKLIIVMGGTFTPYLSVKTKVLVAAQRSGPKMTKVAEWSVPIVNHTWLEDCFLRWQRLPLGAQYTSYPAGIDFDRILGQTGVDVGIAEAIAAEAVKEGVTPPSDQPGDHDSENTASHPHSGTPNRSPFPVHTTNEPLEIAKKTNVVCGLITRPKFPLTTVLAGSRN
ncbi:hypothetical protein DFH09DRAFT_1027211 [Mycena vulgaris]|nr:hypothetical protein DFH09DRAFT_1027211 [Mycena vulgaris]